MWFQIEYSHQHYGRRPSTFNKRNRRWSDLKVVASWVIARRVRLYADEEQQNLTGRVEVVGRGKFDRWCHTERWRQRHVRTDKDGNKHVSWRPRSRVTGYRRTNLKAFRHKVHTCPAAPQRTRVPSLHALFTAPCLLRVR